MSKSDIQIAREASPKNIVEIAKGVGLTNEDIIPYGHDKAKIRLSVMDKFKTKDNAKVVLVTAINPTPAGEARLLHLLD